MASLLIPAFPILLVRDYPYDGPAYNGIYQHDSHAYNGGHRHDGHACNHSYSQYSHAVKHHYPHDRKWTTDYFNPFPNIPF